jgi:hypothetical protein
MPSRDGWQCALAVAAAVLLFTQAIFIDAALAEGWSLVESPSDSGQAAFTTNAEGHRLYVWAKHLQDRSLVFAEIHLENGEEFAGRMPSYRIDDDTPVDTELVRREGEKQGSLWGFVAGRACFWLIWSSDHPVVEPGDHLAKWMTGKLLKLSYQAADGTQKETDFNLEGARGPIERAASLTLH